MKSSRNLFLTLAICAVACCAGSVAAQENSAIEVHPWARFGIGSWKKVRAFSESLNEAGKVESTSVIDTKTTLVEVTETHFTLRVETTVDVAGKKFVADPKQVRQGYHGETTGQTVELKKLGVGEVTIDGRKYPSEIRQVVVNGDDLRRVSLVHVNESMSPHVLRRETTATDAAGTAKNYETLVEVVAVDMPARVLTESKTVSHVKTTHREVHGGTTVTMELHCGDVPGGIVAHSTKELNPAGRTIRRETLELSEYQVIPVELESSTTAQGRRRLFHRGNRTRSGG